MFSTPLNIILSHYQIKPVIQARRAGKTEVQVSPDLGLSLISAELTNEGLRFPAFPDVRLSWKDAERIVKNENACYLLQGDTIEKIQTFSELLQRPYSLYPTASAPTMLIAGFPMHRIQDTNPQLAAMAMVKPLIPIAGAVLDTTTGLGYTSIALAKTAQYVITIELDPAAQYIAKLNPWSRDLFNNPKIEQRIGDSFDLVPTFPANSFDRVLHDPPTMSLAGDLYSEVFYQELYRVLKHRGKLFHYIGDPASKFGASVTKGVIERLTRAGFTRITKRPEAFGVVANK